MLQCRKKVLKMKKDFKILYFNGLKTENNETCKIDDKAKIIRHTSY